ncbi:MAG: hypothetical protein Q7S44_03245 [bacterium]|nr:hypothetical protein [bacterium]
MGKIKITLPRAILLTSASLVLALAALFYSLTFPTNLMTFISGWQQKITPSQAYLRLDGKTMLLKLAVTPQDEITLRQFSQNLGVDEKWAEGLKVELSEENAAAFSNLLPSLKDPLGMKVEVRISPTQLEFGAEETSGIFNPSQEVYKTASFGGMLKVERLTMGGMMVDIEEPGQVMAEAVAAKQGSVSPQLLDEGFFKLLTKVARIKMKVQNHTLSGVLMLK